MESQQILTFMLERVTKYPHTIEACMFLKHLIFCYIYHNTAIEELEFLQVSWQKKMFK